MSDSNAVLFSMVFHKPSYIQASSSNYSIPFWPNLTSFSTQYIRKGNEYENRMKKDILWAKERIYGKKTKTMLGLEFNH